MTPRRFRPIKGAARLPIVQRSFFPPSYLSSLYSKTLLPLLPHVDLAVMYQRDPRSFAYDDHNASYSSGNMANHTPDYTAPNYSDQDSSGHYYTAPAHDMGSASDGVNSPFFRSMTPSLVSTHRYPNSSRITQPRLYNAHGYGGSTSTSVSQPVYPPQNPSYPPQFLPAADQRSLPSSHRPPQSQLQFIPTPSEIAHSYSNYPQGTTPRSPVIPEVPYSSLDYPAPPHMVPSSHGHHPSRIVTGRPRTVSAVTSTSTSPTSASSSSGERFPCEKCGKTFSRSHDRKRHHETQHTPIPVMHTCHHCQKEFSRADSLKRHLDNGCDMHL